MTNKKFLIFSNVRYDTFSCKSLYQDSRFVVARFFEDFWGFFIDTF
jgi:hypothetical protein